MNSCNGSEFTESATTLRTQRGIHDRNKLRRRGNPPEGETLATQAAPKVCGPSSSQEPPSCGRARDGTPRRSIGVYSKAGSQELIYKQNHRATQGTRRWRATFVLNSEL